MAVRAALMGLIAAISTTHTANSTVYQFNDDGTMTINNLPQLQNESDFSHNSSPLSAPTTPQTSHYRSLATATALRYGGSDGVRAAGLTALEFVDLFTALVATESGWNARAVSSAGALGLGQLMPETASGLGVSRPFDPAENLDGAARYLLAQLERFGRVDSALAAYNAGPERVVEYGGIPPIPETIAYVAAVMEAAGIGVDVPVGVVEIGQPQVVLGPPRQ